MLNPPIENAVRAIEYVLNHHRRNLWSRDMRTLLEAIEALKGLQKDGFQ